MLDPFPAAPEWLVKATEPVAASLNLPTLPLHIHEILITAVFYHWLYLFGAPALSKRLIPSYYAEFNKRTRLNWNVHIVSFVQSVVVCVFALWTIRADTERADFTWQGRVFGYTGATGVVQALGAGYFVWDLYICLRHFDIFGAGMLAHAISAISVFCLGFRPFVNFYAPTFILYELSSPFLNIHWACDKLQLTGSIYQLVNGVVLIIVFFGARLCYGTYSSYCVMHDIYTAIRASGSGAAFAGVPEAKAPATIRSSSELEELMRFYNHGTVPLWVAGVYLGSNLVLNSLNWYWFAKMITTIKGRFEPGAQKVAKEKQLSHSDASATGAEVKTDARKRRA